MPSPHLEFVKNSLIPHFEDINEDNIISATKLLFESRESLEKELEEMRNNLINKGENKFNKAEEKSEIVQLFSRRYISFTIKNMLALFLFSFAYNGFSISFPIILKYIHTNNVKDNTNNNAFDLPITVLGGSGGVLPVKLESIDGLSDKCNAQVKWSTSNETNLSKFEMVIEMGIITLGK